MIDWYFQVGAKLPQNQSAMSDTKITAISNTHLRGLLFAVNSHEHEHATMHVTSPHCFTLVFHSSQVRGVHSVQTETVMLPELENYFFLYDLVAQHEDVCRNGGRAPLTLNVRT
jgi:hypothetical protein